MYKEDLEYRYIWNRQLKAVEEQIIERIRKGEYVYDIIDRRTRVLDKLRIK